MSNGLKNVFAGFRDFIMRGNVIDLATAVVVGAAFTAVIKAFTDFIINPILAVFGGVNAQGFGFQITSNPKTFIDIGAVITASIQFLITAAVLYFLVVVPMGKIRERRKVVAEAAPPPADVLLLEEIRDLLKEGVAGSGTASGGAPGNTPTKTL